MSHIGENIDLPMGTFGYTMSCMHCMTVSLAYGGEGLGTMWGVQKARELFTDSGFEKIEIHTVDGDLFNNYYVCHKTACRLDLSYALWVPGRRLVRGGFRSSSLWSM